MKNTSTYRLPDGTVTTDPDVYGDAWLALGKALEAIFTGYKADAFNPGIRLTKWHVNALGQSVVYDQVQLSVRAAEVLLKKLEIP